MAAASSSAFASLIVTPPGPGSLSVRLHPARAMAARRMRQAGRIIALSYIKEKGARSCRAERSEERRGGKEGVSKGRSRGSEHHTKKKRRTIVSKSTKQTR